MNIYANRLTICVFYNIVGVSKSPPLFFNNIPALVVNKLNNLLFARAVRGAVDF
jgi:hypothetical protein